MAQPRLTFYQGAYTIELQPGAKTDHLPGSTTVRGNTVLVQRGTVQQVMGGIQFYADQRPFSWGYRFIRRISDVQGQILWENWDIQKERESIINQIYQANLYPNDRGEERTNDPRVRVLVEYFQAENDDKARQLASEKYGLSQDVELYAYNGHRRLDF